MNAPQIMKNNRDKVVESLETNRESLEALMPTHMSWQANLAMLDHALRKTTGLLECTPISIRNCIETAFKAGLEPNTVLQECWLLPFRDKDGRLNAELIIGYKGWIKLALNSGFVKPGGVTARCIYRSEYENGLVQLSEMPKEIKHRLDLSMSADDFKDQDIIGAYAVFELTGGGTVQSILRKDELDKLEKASKIGWSSNKKFPTRYPGMCRKTAILQAFHRREVPISSEIKAAMEAEKKVEEVMATAYEVINEEDAAKARAEVPQIGSTEDFAPSGRDAPKVTELPEECYEPPMTSDGELMF